MASISYMKYKRLPNYRKTHSTPEALAPSSANLMDFFFLLYRINKRNKQEGTNSIGEQDKEKMILRKHA